MRMTMPWIYLILAGLLEIVWAIGIKYTEGFSRPVPTIITVIAMAVSMYLLALSVRTLPVGTAYAIWVGIGAVGTAIMGMILFDEPAHWYRVVSLMCILIGIAGLKLTAGQS